MRRHGATAPATASALVRAPGRGLAAALLAVVVLLLGSPTARADRGGYRIDSYHTDLTVEASSELVVEERIEARFLEPRHGLYRTIPVSYTDPKGYTYSLGFELVDVRDAEGRPHQAKVRRQGHYVNVRIGDPDRTVTGVVVYRLRYRIRRALGHFPTHDELYWNAVGHEFQTTIGEATASLRLPAVFPPGELQVAAYAGRFGSRDQNVDIDFPEPGVVWFAVPGRLEPLEGLTVAVGWPKGAVSEPGPIDRLVRLLGDNWIALAPFLAFAWLWRRYRTLGRDPQGRGSVVVRYEPPPGATPGEIGTIVDERVEMRDITATIVDLAVRGHLQISIEKHDVFFGLFDSETIVFERRRDADDSALLGHERAVLDGLFAGGDRVELSDLQNRFYKQIPPIREALQQRMVDQGWFRGHARRIRQRYAVGGLFAGGVVLAVGFAWIKLRGGVLPHALVVPVLAAVVTTMLFILFARAMPQRTRRGVELRGWALGFEEFVERVEGPRLEEDRRRGVFEALLPYAMALGVAAAWARRFEGIYADESPHWFAGHHTTGRLSTADFESSLSSAMSRAGQTLASSPRSSGSSGSGGGGSSGGGGGGGGGGSW